MQVSAAPRPRGPPDRPAVADRVERGMILRADRTKDKGRPPPSVNAKAKR